MDENFTLPAHNWETFLLSNTSVPEVDSSEEVVRMIQVIGRPPIIILGTFGNFVTFITMQRGSLKILSTCFYMAILGLADTGRFSFAHFNSSVPPQILKNILHFLFHYRQQYIKKTVNVKSHYLPRRRQHSRL